MYLFATSGLFLSEKQSKAGNMKKAHLGYEINQRQVPISGILKGYANENTLIEKEFIGTLFIKEGTNTITIVLKDGREKSGTNMFLLHRIYLEKSVNN